MRILSSILLSIGLISSAAAAEEIGEVSTNYNLIGPDDKLAIQAFNDPRVPGVACHLSLPRTGGISGALGIAEDKSDASIACRQFGPIEADLTALKKVDGERVFTESTSILFKKMQVVRFIDVGRNTIIYLAFSDRLIDGSPKNAISTVPVQPWGK